MAIGKSFLFLRISTGRGWWIMSQKPMSSLIGSRSTTKQKKNAEAFNPNVSLEGLHDLQCFCCVTVGEPIGSFFFSLLANIF